jgi:hypothetical protein
VWPFLLLHSLLFATMCTADIFSSHYTPAAPGALERSPATSDNTNTNNSGGEGAWFAHGSADLNSPEVAVALVGIPVLLAAQLVLFLLGQWSVALKCSLGHTRVSGVGAYITYIRIYVYMYTCIYIYMYIYIYIYT